MPGLLIYRTLVQVVGATTTETSGHTNEIRVSRDTQGRHAAAWGAAVTLH